MSARTSDHEHMGVAPRMWRRGTQVCSPASILMVNAFLTPPQRPLRASLTVSAAVLMVSCPRKPHRGFSCLIFDHPPALASTVATLTLTDGPVT
jgi:hypothetical protein